MDRHREELMRLSRGRACWSQHAHAHNTYALVQACQRGLPVCSCTGAEANRRAAAAAVRRATEKAIGRRRVLKRNPVSDSKQKT